jgi:hypothetical protein
MRKPTVVDLFCGSGGMSWGLHKAGFKILTMKLMLAYCLRRTTAYPSVGDVAFSLLQGQGFSLYYRLQLSAKQKYQRCLGRLADIGRRGLQFLTYRFWKTVPDANQWTMTKSQ